MLAGTRFIKAGYQSFWGPGRHKFGSNWFWYPARASLDEGAP